MYFETQHSERPDLHLDTSLLGILATNQKPTCSSLSNNVMKTVSAAAGFALFVIACMGIAGTFPGAKTLGWTTLGLGVSLAGLSLLTHVLTPDSPLKKAAMPVIVLNIILFSAMAVVGGLGGAGMLSLGQIGWGVLGTQLASIPMFCGTCCCSIYLLRKYNADSLPVYH